MPLCVSPCGSMLDTHALAGVFITLITWSTDSKYHIVLLQCIASDIVMMSFIVIMLDLQVPVELLPHLVTLKLSAILLNFISYSPTQSFAGAITVIVISVSPP